MDIYIAEARFGDRSDLPAAIQLYKTKAGKFQSDLSVVAAKYGDYLPGRRLKLGVETVDNFENCTIKLKRLPEDMGEELSTEIILLFNTTWSQ